MSDPTYESVSALVNYDINTLEEALVAGVSFPLVETQVIANDNAVSGQAVTDFVAPTVAKVDANETAIANAISRVRKIVSQEYLKSVTPFCGIYRTGPYAGIGIPYSDGMLAAQVFMTTLEDFHPSPNKIVEYGYSSDVFLEKVTPFLSSSLIISPLSSGGLQKLVDEEYKGLVLANGYATREAMESNLTILTAFEYHDMVTKALEVKPLDSNGVFCHLNFWFGTDTQYSGAISDKLKSIASKVRTYDHSAIEVSVVDGDNASGPEVYQFNIWYPMDGQGSETYGMTPEMSDVTASLNFIKSLRDTLGQNILLYVSTFGLTSPVHIGEKIAEKGLADITITNQWFLPNVAAEGVRVLVPYRVDATSDFAAFATEHGLNINNQYFAMGVMDRILIERVIASAREINHLPTKDDVKNVLPTLTLDESAIGFGSMTKGGFSQGLHISDFHVGTVDANGELQFPA